MHVKFHSQEGMIWVRLHLSAWIFWNVVRLLVSACLRTFCLCLTLRLNLPTGGFCKALVPRVPWGRKSAGLSNMFEALRDSKFHFWKKSQVLLAHEGFENFWTSTKLGLPCSLDFPDFISHIYHFLVSDHTGLPVSPQTCHQHSLHVLCFLSLNLSLFPPESLKGPSCLR